MFKGIRKHGAQVEGGNNAPDLNTAMEAYSQIHQKSPDRELYVIHTDKETIEILERRWLRG